MDHVHLLTDAQTEFAELGDHLGQSLPWRCAIPALFATFPRCKNHEEEVVIENLLVEKEIRRRRKFF